MQRQERDFFLAQHAPAVMDTVATAAQLTINVLKHSTQKADTARVALAKEIAERFTMQSVLLQTFMLDHRDGMTEAELRAWAAGLKEALTS